MLMHGNESVLFYPISTDLVSMSVSDVIVFHKDGRDNAYFVDSFGFTEVPESS